MKKKGLTPKKLIQKVFQWILVVFGVLNNILKVYQNIPPRKPSLQRNFQLILVLLDMLMNILKYKENTPSGKASFSRWRPKWWPAKLKMAIYLNRKRLFK